MRGGCRRHKIIGMDLSKITLSESLAARVNAVACSYELPDVFCMAAHECGVQAEYPVQGVSTPELIDWAESQGCYVWRLNWSDPDTYPQCGSRGEALRNGARAFVTVNLS